MCKEKLYPESSSLLQNLQKTSKRNGRSTRTGFCRRSFEIVEQWSITVAGEIRNWIPSLCQSIAALPSSGATIITSTQRSSQSSCATFSYLPND